MSDKRIRRWAKRLGLVARKVRNDGYGNAGWFLVDPSTRGIVAGNWCGNCTMALDSEQAIEWLEEYQRS
jgi:hypothetical protein